MFKHDGWTFQSVHGGWLTASDDGHVITGKKNENPSKYFVIGSWIRESGTNLVSEDGPQNLEQKKSSKTSRLLMPFYMLVRRRSDNLKKK